MRAYTHTHTQTYIYIYIYVCVCVCVCVDTKYKKKTKYSNVLTEKKTQKLFSVFRFIFHLKHQLYYPEDGCIDRNFGTFHIKNASSEYYFSFTCRRFSSLYFLIIGYFLRLHISFSFKPALKGRPGLALLSQ